MPEPEPLPRDLNDLLKTPPPPKKQEVAAPKEKEYSVLAPKDEAYLNKLIAMVRQGKRAVMIVEDGDDKLKYMFSNASRAEAVAMLGKVIEATGRKLANGEG